MFRLPAGIFIPYLQVISSVILSGLLILTLFFVNFKVSIIILLTIVIIYFQIFKFFRKKLYLTSVNISLSHKKIYEIVSYSLGLNKDVKIYNLENFINKKFSFLSKKLISTRSFANFISSSPKYIVETIAILFSMLAITIAYKSGKFNEEIILFFMFFGILSIKIIPAIQAVYVSLSIIQSNKSLMDNLPKINFNEFKFKNRINNFRRSIELKNVNFSYENNKNILSNINLKIKKGDTISIVGSNGSGKTTLINLISGFIKPSSGKIYYDEKVISNGNIFGLFSILDPNPIFMNSNIYENICFKENITIKEKKKINEILQFVELSSKNLKKYNSENLEAKVSQGEKQKIALARFLYFKKEFLIIDEGTTNLSSKLEFRLLKKIRKNYPSLTIIFITHRFVNLSFFNYIYEIKNQKLHKLKSYN
jgi:ABC-type multidrug transport system fused ATPase/permease subunit